MGIFDGSNYAPVGNGNWLDGLMQSLGVQPSAGFPASPMNANAAMPAPAVPQTPTNAPIEIGDYQMPRIGSGFDLPPGQLDPNTGEHVAPSPTAAPAPQPAAPGPLSSFFNSMSTGLGSIARGGSVAGAINGTPDDVKSTQQRQLQQQFQAFVSAGMSPQRAQLAVLNPEAAKTLVTNTFGPHSAENLGQGYIRDPLSGKVTRAYTPEQNDSFSVVPTGEDGLGKKTFAKMNKATGEMTPIAAAPGSDAAGGIGLGDMTKTGAEYLATVPPAQRGTLQAMIDGRLAPPGSFALSKPYWQNMIAAANNIDPTFDATNWSARVAGAKDFSAGKSSEMVRGANQTLHHAGEFLKSMDALNNGNYPSLNWTGNKIDEATGGGAPTAFRLNAHAVSEEMSKVFKGANMSDAEIHAWEDNLSPNMSPAQQRAAVGKLKDLLQGSLQALDEKRVASMGQMAADKAGPIIKPEGQKVLQQIDAWLKAGNGAAAAGTAPTGVKWSVVQ